MKNVKIIDHPLIQHKLTKIRDKNTGSKDFREAVKEVSLLLGYEATRDLTLKEKKIETPMEKYTAQVLDGTKPVLVSILRAGNGLLDGMLNLLPEAQVGHIGLYRDRKNESVVEYYFKVPEIKPNQKVIVLDPMLATGKTASAAVSQIKKKGAENIIFVCVIAAPEGIKYFRERHSDVKIITAALDRELSPEKYILPGLGDAGDRIYGTL
jgi:uracil phosphoribosyltransferase